MLFLSVQSTAKAKPTPADSVSNVSHTTVVAFRELAPTVASTPLSDTSVKATTKLPNVGFSSSALANPQSAQADVRGATGLSLELYGISLTPSRHVELTAENSDRVLNSTPVKQVKHCLDFDESDSGIRPPKLQRKGVCVDEESDVHKPMVDNCHVSPVRVEPDANRSCRQKNVVFHASLPISVSQSQNDLDKFASITPVTQRSHKFLVCFF